MSSLSLTVARAHPAPRGLRIVLVTVGLASLVLAAGFWLQQPWATSLWPWPGSRLSNVFLAAILAASGVPVVWIGWRGELAAITAGAIDLIVTYAGFAAYAIGTWAGAPQRSAALNFALACLAGAVVCLLLLLRVRKIPFRDTRPLPWTVRVSFFAFCATLACLGAALVSNAANVFPWRIGAEQSVLYGWIFIGAACYFLYALLHPVRGNATGQMLGFLAYDLVLIVPFARHFETVEPALRINLVVYTFVLVYSALLAVLFLARSAIDDPATRRRT